MFLLKNFIQQNVIHRSESMFAADLKQNDAVLSREIQGKKVLVIGGAGTIGASFIRALLPFKPAKLVVVDICENGLTELTRDLRSTYNLYMPAEYLTYPLNFADPIFERILFREKGFDIVANFSAHKHVRSEKDIFSVEALIENNVIKAQQLLKLLTQVPPEHFFCVSTDKAANPVNIMGASKRVMEDLIMSYSDVFKVTTARFANVAFSNGSLPAGFLERFNKRQPFSAPQDIRRYFVSPEESGQICLMACLLGRNREIFFPKLSENQMMTFTELADLLLHDLGYVPKYCASEEEARRFAAEMPPDSKSYPVYYFKSDTTGEKSFEEFFISGESVDMERFQSLGVITDIAMPDRVRLEALLAELREYFSSADTDKAMVVNCLKKYLPNFHHVETGKNLDQKM